MMGSNPAHDRQQQLVEIERQIASALQSAGQAMQELSKDKPSIKQMEAHTNSYVKTLEKVESGLYKQIEYLTQVSTSQPHEGSSYAAQKDVQMARHRLEHVKSRVNDLERTRAEQRIRQQHMMQQRQMSGDHLANMQRGGYAMDQRQADYQQNN